MTAPEALAWLTLPTAVRELVKSARPMANMALPAVVGLEADVWLDPEAQLVATAGPDEKTAAARIRSAGLMAHAVRPTGPGPWVRIKSADAVPADLLNPALQAGGLAPSAWQKPLGGPTPLLAMLASGALGAGAGYLGGRLVDANVPGTTGRRARHTGAMLGALLGAAPGAALGAVGMQHSENADNPWAAWVRPNVMFGKAAADEAFAKAADDSGSIFLRDIPVDSFGRLVMEDPFAPLATRSTAASVVEAASQSLGGTGLVSPFDIARTLASAGVGYLTGMTVGRVLGAVAGMTPPAQQALSRTGALAGVLQSVIPRISQ